MADTVVYQLSSIDQSVIRTHIRLALCFPCKPSQTTAVADRLARSVKRAICYAPILAGRVYSVGNETKTFDRRLRSNSTTAGGQSQHGRVEVRVSLADAQNFQATLQYPGAAFPHTYDSLAAQGMPATALIDGTGVLTPLPDMPSGEGCPVFVVQANFLQGGGLIVVLFLHHSVADLQGLSTAIRHMSISEDVLATREITYGLLLEDALIQTAMRKRLCGSNGLEANLDEHPEYNIKTSAASTTSRAPSHGAARMIGFSIEALETTRDLINQRFHQTKDIPGPRLSKFDVLTAILWKVISRARYSEGQESTLIFPVSIRNRMSPPLELQYYGNACMFATTQKSMTHLKSALDVSSLADTALDIRVAINAMVEEKVRSGIAIIEESSDVRTLNHPAIDFDNDVFFTSWASLPVGEESALGLGLGRSEWIRKPSREHAGYGCVIMPVKDAEWPVLLQLTTDVLQRLLKDPGLEPFVASIA